MIVGEFHVGDIGATLRLTVEEAGVALDISSATTRKFRLKKPEGQVIEVNASFQTDGSDGVLEWVTTSLDDLDQPGEWKVQPYLVMSGWTGHTDFESFKVDPKV